VFAYLPGVRSWRLPAALAAVALVLVLGGGAASAADGAFAQGLKLDGVAFRPELAITSEQRSTGLMFRKRAPADGMLFVFGQDTTGGFWMMNTLVPLRIVFFDSQGKRVKQLRMTPCRSESCPTYSPGRRYRFALELRATDTRLAARIGPLAKLRVLTRSAA
jgi:uncharacterized membrane protein (UPF0127 family)